MERLCTLLSELSMTMRPNMTPESPTAQLARYLRALPRLQAQHNALPLPFAMLLCSLYPNRSEGGNQVKRHACRAWNAAQGQSCLGRQCNL